MKVRPGEFEDLYQRKSKPPSGFPPARTRQEDFPGGHLIMSLVKLGVGNADSIVAFNELGSPLPLGGRIRCSKPEMTQAKPWWLLLWP